MIHKDYKALAKKAYHPSRLTDKQLAQLYRSSRTGANLLAKVRGEMFKRGLVNSEGREFKKRIRDYDD